MCGYLKIRVGAGNGKIPRGSSDAESVSYRSEPVVEPRQAESGITWVSEAHECSDDTISSILDGIDSRISGDTILNLSLAGYIGVEMSLELKNRLQSLSDRVIDLQLDNKVRITPSNEELSRCATDDTLKRIFETLLSIREGKSESLPSLPPEPASFSFPDGGEPDLAETADEALLLFHELLKE